MDAMMAMRLDLPGELDAPMNPVAAGDLLNARDGYEMTEADQRMAATGQGQLIGQFLLDRDGIVRWTFTEAAGRGEHMFGIPAPQEVMSAAAQVAA
jgi:hypothetical protein